MRCVYTETEIKCHYVLMSLVLNPSDKAYMLLVYDT